MNEILYILCCFESINNWKICKIFVTVPRISMETIQRVRIIKIIITNFLPSFHFVFLVLYSFSCSRIDLKAFVKFYFHSARRWSNYVFFLFHTSYRFYALISINFDSKTFDETFATLSRRINLRISRDVLNVLWDNLSFFFTDKYLK